MQNKMDKQTDQLNQGLRNAYCKMLVFKKYKGTPVAVSKNGKIKLLSTDELLAENKVN